MEAVSLISFIRDADNHTDCNESPCEVDNVQCVAINLVDETICLAHKLLQQDPQQLLLYKQPIESVSEEISYDSDETEEISWVSIVYFSVSEALLQIEQYINRWQVSPFTKFVVEPKGESIVPGLGKRYYVDALFSKPTPKCPNPLAVANVHFSLHVSNLMPGYYPIMVTYRFEGYKTIYYALGERCLYTMTFQRFYIDTILHMKLSFYAKIVECIYPPAPEEGITEDVEKQSVGDQDKESVEEETEGKDYSKLL